MTASSLTPTRSPCILLVGTADTKAEELAFLRRHIEAAEGSVCLMDVGVLGHAPIPVEVSAAEVAAAAGASLDQVRNASDENEAMCRMALGAARLAKALHSAGRVHGALILGGTMGTDLSLDVAAALPLGVPKVVVSTVAHSHLIPPERVAPDLIIMLWAGGLYGLNPLCESTLRQAAGAVVGACRSAEEPARVRPLVGMTSFGSSALSYMLRLRPALAERGFDLAVFHATGMGGRAFEAMAAEGRFAAVMDFCLQEVSNHVHGSVVTAGPDRLSGAGRAGVPQLVAPGAIDMIDFAGWQPLPAAMQDRPARAHNRLLYSVAATADERRATARQIAAQLAQARGPVHLLLPLQGIEQWDRPGEPLHDPLALAAFHTEMRRVLPADVRVTELPAHINDDAFSDAALAVFDDWVQRGVVRRALHDVTAQARG